MPYEESYPFHHLGPLVAMREKKSPRSFTAIRKDAGLCCGSRLRKGEEFAYVGRNQNREDLKPKGLYHEKRGGALLHHEKSRLA